MDRRGITLIELIIVLVIIAIAATFFVPGIGAWVPHYRLRSDTRNIVSTMRKAQMMAISNNTEFRVAFDINGGTYTLQRNSGGVWVDEGGIQSLSKGIQFFSCDFPEQGGRRTAVFNPNSTSSRGSITLQNLKGTTRRIFLTEATARIRIEE